MNTNTETMPIDANVTIRKKTTIPNKQKTTLKLILWTLTRVMDLETANAKAIEMFKLGESIETIIEEVDNIEKSAEYAEMETNLASLCVKPAKKSRAKKEAITISGDADTIIKEMVEMATAEVKTTPVKKPRVKKVAGETDVLVPVLDEETKPLAKAKARTKTTTKKTKNEIDDDSRPEPTWVDTPESVLEVETRLRHNNPNSSTEVSCDVKVEEPETKPATKSKTKPKSKVVSEDDTVEKEEPVKKSNAKPNAKPKPKAKEDDNVEKEEPVKKSKAKPKPKAKEDDNVEKEEPVKKPKAKPATKSKIVEPQEETPVTNDLAEEEYLVLNEVEYEGKQYMVGGDQNVYDEFNSVIGKYENGIITLNA
jgi:hypothetical protein